VANENKPYHHHQQYHPHLCFFSLPSLLILTYHLHPHPPLQLAQSKLFYSTASLSLPVSILFSFMSSLFLEFMDLWWCQHDPKTDWKLERKASGAL
jgi:hypothetical protein